MGPILATKRLPPGDGYRFPRVFCVEGGLHKIGEQAPYFSLTYTCHRVGNSQLDYEGGAGHEAIEREFPGQFTELARLHLATMDGMPLAAAANGLYWLAGSLGGLGERYHGGNSNPARTPAECLEIFRDLWRLTDEEAALFQRQLREIHEAGEDCKAFMQRKADGSRYSWKAEADAAIKRYDLKVYED